MPIATAIQKGNTVFVYDERNRPLFNVHAGSGPRDGLVGYTATTVSVRRGNTVFVYDQRGHFKFNHSV